jgi:hypothetical protein
MSILTKIIELVKGHQEKFWLAIIIFLTAILAFSLGWILAKLEEKKPLEFFYESSASYRYYNGWQSKMG